MEKVGCYATKLDNAIAIITGKHARKSGILGIAIRSIKEEDLNVIDVFDGARPNAPKEDVYRLAYQLSKLEWDGVVAIGGGSCIDASKAAITLATYGGLIGSSRWELEK